ncbi:RpiR family transcriptional regulator [Vibrio sp. MACH09]|uniref:MurR/RpiR family transcriptional regulator n=1 Tax=unclassified Vibrio TaxID=2614977 RepID=UPI00149368CE|nr:MULTISPECIES: MurR/RpiR family transcriptional regulator [unclassified Vibrio]NOI67150.1 MurR/RpiR family transcriptional regulator [Vibrio sp. 99-8-1]GLO63484.1 RpiR family transcriptional regulator [Vibrio sp. MACH09]
MLVATNLIELQDQIRSRYDELSKRLQEVAGYIIENPNSVAFDTVAIIAEKADVPPSTLIRFANAFGFTGFNDMKQIFRKNMVEETTNYSDRVRLFEELEGEAPSLERPADILQEFAHANTKALACLAAQTSTEELEKAVNLLSDAENIYIIGMQKSFSAASYLNYALLHLNRRASLIDGLGGMHREQMNVVGPKDVVLTISFSPYSKDTIMLSELVAKAGANHIVITDSQISPLAKFNDTLFVVKEAELAGFRSQAALHCLLQTLVVSLAFKQK